jgi:hypothetical protein
VSSLKLFPAKSSVLDFVSSRFQHSNAFVLRRIHVHRNAIHSSQRLREYVPAPFVFGEIKKI